MSDFEDALTEILDSALTKDEKILQLSKIIIRHAPKRFSGWSDHLRRIADYIDNRPQPVELSAKAIAGLIELSWKG